MVRDQHPDKGTDTHKKAQEAREQDFLSRLLCFSGLTSFWKAFIWLVGIPSRRARRKHHPGVRDRWAADW